MITSLNLQCYDTLRLGYWGSLQNSHVTYPEQDPLGKATDAIYRIDNVVYDPLKTIQRYELRLMR